MFPGHGLARHEHAGADRVEIGDAGEFHRHPLAGLEIQIDNRLEELRAFSVSRSPTSRSRARPSGQQ
jgi:hypothetical protein